LTNAVSKHGMRIEGKKTCNGREGILASEEYLKSKNKIVSMCRTSIIANTTYRWTCLEKL